jgi:hypothetical protein
MDRNGSLTSRSALAYRGGEDPAPGSLGSLEDEVLSPLGFRASSRTRAIAEAIYRVQRVDCLCSEWRSNIGCRCQARRSYLPKIMEALTVAKANVAEWTALLPRVTVPAGMKWYYNSAGELQLQGSPPEEVSSSQG